MQEKIRQAQENLRTCTGRHEGQRPVLEDQPDYSDLVWGVERYVSRERVCRSRYQSYCVTHVGMLAHQRPG